MSNSVSIIITSYNQKEFIFDTLQSCLNQTYNSIELIVIDDCSDPNEFDKDDIKVYILLNKGPNITNFVILVNEFNIGHSKSLAVAFAKCNSNYIVYVNGDDLIPSHSISQLMFALIDGKYDIIGGELIHLNKGETSPIQLEKTSISHKTLNIYKGLFDLPISMPGTLFKRDFFKVVLDFEVSFKYFEDAFLYLKIIKTNPNVRIGKINNVNYVWRSYSGVTIDNSLKSKRNIELIRDHINFIELILRNYRLDLKAREIKQLKLKLKELKFTLIFTELENHKFRKIIHILANLNYIIRRITLTRIFRYLKPR